MGGDMNGCVIPFPKLQADICRLHNRYYELEAQRLASSQPMRGEVISFASPLALFVASFAFGLALWWGR